MKLKSILFFSVLFFFCQSLFAQTPSKRTGDIDYSHPQEYEIGGITVTGIEYLSADAVISITGLRTGDHIQIPGEELSNALRKLWENGLVGDAEVSISKIEGSVVYLNFYLKERPRLSRFTFSGVKKSEQEDLKDKVDYSRGTIVNDALIKNTQKKIKDFYLDKGYLNAKVDITKVKDTLLGNYIMLKVAVDKMDKIHIKNIVVSGNEAFPDKKIKKKLKKTKEKRFYKIFTSSKFIQKEYDGDKQKLINFYNANGYRDIEITDSIYPVDHNHINIELNVSEGHKYYFRNITWKGNFIYPDTVLSQILSIEKGTPYSSELLQKRLNYNPSGIDLSSLYLDNGYLFFSVDPVEILVEGDSIDIEMRIFEGNQATIDQITVSGNTKTHDHVILRELYTIPGQKFNRSDLIRTQMSLAGMGYFDTDKININPIPNPQKGTVDIHYSVEEKPSDQIELSGGWGGGYGFIGTVGLVFNNFSTRNLLRFKDWSPLPAGDGQRFSIRLQASGKTYQTLTLSFTEPWLGGKKPNSLTTSVSYSNINSVNIEGKISGHLGVFGTTVGLGRRLIKFWDNITLQNSLSYNRYILKNYASYASQLGLSSGNGTANNISFTTTISRYMMNEMQNNNPVFPISGSNISFSAILTPPYSLFSKPDPANPYKMVEFHKWMIDNQWFVPIFQGKNRSLVLRMGAHFGFIGSYRKSTPIGPFERFKLGGSGLSGFNFMLASELIGLRGYPDPSNSPNLLPLDQNGNVISSGGTIYDKLVFELRYPVHLSNAFSIFTVSFFEAGNSWGNFKDFNPFNVYRAAGFGLRLNMPAFGMIGLDYGWPLDLLPGAPKRQGQFTFSIGQQIR